MSDVGDREFWQGLITCAEAAAGLIKKHKLEPPPPGIPSRVFDPTMEHPKKERQFWQDMRRNLLSLSMTIKANKIGGSSTVKLDDRRKRRYREPRLDKPPGKRTG